MIYNAPLPYMSFSETQNTQILGSSRKRGEMKYPSRYLAHAKAIHMPLFRPPTHHVHISWYAHQSLLNPILAASPHSPSLPPAVLEVPPHPLKQAIYKSHFTWHKPLTKNIGHNPTISSRSESSTQAIHTAPYNNHSSHDIIHKSHRTW